MGRVRYDKADPKLPAHKGGKRWLHRRGGKALRADGSYHLVDAIYFHPGKSYDVTDYEAEWLAKRFPQCFSVVEAPKKAAKKAAKPESDSEGEE